eukprot:Pgem_evm1s1581
MNATIGFPVLVNGYDGVTCEGTTNIYTFQNANSCVNIPVIGAYVKATYISENTYHAEVFNNSACTGSVLEEEIIEKGECISLEPDGLNYSFEIPGSASISSVMSVAVLTS